MKIEGALTVRAGHGLAASERWLELLAQLPKKRSIVRAAKAAGLSYKAAWDAIEAMNNLADEPLVERAVGGRGGGGTRLTTAGERLVQTFREVQREHAAFLQQLNRRLGNAAEQLRVLGRFGMKSSARNQFVGTVERVRRGAVNDEVVMQLRGGEQLVAIITRESTEQLHLAPGTPVMAWIKSSSVIIAIEDEQPLRLSARNQLRGSITRITRGAVNTEVVLEIAGGNTVAATITNVSARELKLKRGLQACAVIKASMVILAVAE